MKYVYLFKVLNMRVVYQFILIIKKGILVSFFCINHSLHFNSTTDFTIILYKTSVTKRGIVDIITSVWKPSFSP